MATEEKTTYAFIPPPPLPEFYLAKMKYRKEESISSTSSEQEPTRERLVQNVLAQGDGAYDGKPVMFSRQRPSSAPIIAIPAPRPPADMKDAAPAPLAIYHICRLCLRPRSPRYHREHPIPVDGLPPPPGICRRCRVTSVEEIGKIADVVKQGESNEIKIGCIAPFVPKEAIVSNKEMRSLRAQQWLRERSIERQPSPQEEERRRDIVYRHVRVVDAPEISLREKKTKVAFTAQETIENANDDPPPEPLQAPNIAATSMQVQPTENPPTARAQSVKSAALEKMDSMNASVSTKSTSSRRSGSKSTAEASVKVKRFSDSKHIESEIRRVAKDEIERHAQTLRKPELTKSDIRKISREEVEKYRQAERRLEHHPDPYAHGRLVPVERRIDKESDVPETLPWAEFSKKNAIPEVASAPAQRRDSESSTVTDAKRVQRSPSSQANSDSWGPKWRRELSAERKTSSSTRANDIAKQSHPPRSSSQVGRHVADILLREPADKSDPVEVTRIGEGILGPSKQPKSKKQSGPGVIEAKTPESRVPYPPANAKTIGSVASSDHKVSHTKELQARNDDSSVRKRTNSTHWRDESVVHTLESRSSRQDEGPQPDRTCGSRSEGQKTSQTSLFQKRKAFPYLEDNIGNSGNSRPVELPTETPYNSRKQRENRSKKDQDQDYEYTERIVQPANRPLGSRPFDEFPGARRVEVEELVEVRRHPQQPSISQEHRDRRNRREQERHKPSKDAIEDSNHVKFASKVDISPTPPGSDASSSAFRSYHSFGRGSSRQMDGQGGSERGEDLIAEFERRGRTHSRDTSSRHSYYHESDTTSERIRDREATVKPTGHQWKHDGSGIRPLDRALSESPSRELLAQLFKEQNDDSRGPYRKEEKVTASMRAEDGSRGARVRAESDGFDSRKQNFERGPRMR